MIRANRRARVAALAALEADKVWHKSDSMGVWRANYSAAVDLVLAAALPHLTDDGAAAPPADPNGTPALTGADQAAESATTTAAPSSPHLEELAVAIRRHTLFPADEVETRETCACGWRPTGNPMLAYSEHACHVRDALVAAGFVGEGATPAIDREAVEGEVREALQDLGIVAYPTSARNDAEEPLDIECVVGHVAGFILPLVTDSPNYRERIRREVAEEIAQALDAIPATVYPEDIFPPDGTSVDAQSARVMRFAYPAAARIARDMGEAQ